MATGTLETQKPGTTQLKRVLGLGDLVYYGIILTSPIAAVPLFGEAQMLSRGHTVTTLLLAMVAMSVTAVSFGRMANVYPSSGSVYTYISRTLNPHVGFVVGWAMFLEYLFQPIRACSPFAPRCSTLMKREVAGELGNCSAICLSLRYFRAQ